MSSIQRTKKLALVDCKSFYVSCERLFNPRINPAMTGFNVGCIDEINTFDIKEVPVNNGQNHIKDRK